MNDDQTTVVEPTDAPAATGEQVVETAKEVLNNVPAMSIVDEVPDQSPVPEAPVVAVPAPAGEPAPADIWETADSAAPAPAPMPEASAEAAPAPMDIPPAA